MNYTEVVEARKNQTVLTCSKTGKIGKVLEIIVLFGKDYAKFETENGKVISVEIENLQK